MRVYLKLINQYRFQRFISGFLLSTFFVMQYMLPISLVLLSSVTISRDQISLLLERPTDVNESTGQLSGDLTNTSNHTDALTSKIFFILGTLSILLGAINNTVQPAESYVISARFHGRFTRRQYELELRLFELLQQDSEISALIELLKRENKVLFDLVNDYHEARLVRGQKFTDKSQDK